MIEYLKSAHPDTGKERVPKVSSWQQTLARGFFQAFGGVFPRWTAQLAYKIFGTPRWRARHTRPDALILAARVVDFPFQNETIKCYEWGDAAASKTVLLAHGWESRGTALRMYVPDLLEKGYKIVAFDALGHGDSTGKRNNLLTNAQTVLALSKHYGGFYAAIAHSFGCASIIYAMDFLDKTLTINRLVFLAVPPRLRKIVEGVFQMLALPKAAQNKFIAHIDQMTGHSIEQTDVATASETTKNHVEKLLLIHDEHDEVTNIDAAKRIETTWKNALLLVTSGYGHFRIAKNPDVIKRIIGFING
jgi:predicted alpha/beta hydrolase family esterase